MENVPWVKQIFSNLSGKENGPGKVVQGSQAGPFWWHVLRTECLEDHGNTLYPKESLFAI